MISVEFSHQIVSWYKKNKRDLPWRKTKDPYKIWISEIMLQQTTVNAVIPYFYRWVKIFPDIQALSKSKIQAVLNIWQGLGYYQRARNIKKAAEIIVRKFKGSMPSTFSELSKLPGFGPYTAGAVLSLAFNKRIPIVDANVRRVMMRVLSIKGESGSRHDKIIYNILTDILPCSNMMSSFNQGLMELGALVCRKREPICGLCPVRSYCKAYDKGIQEIIPLPKRKILKHIYVAVAIIEKDKKFLIQRRPEKGLLAGLWEFPGGKIKDSETTLEALKREIKEEIGSDIVWAKKYLQIKHFYTQFCAHLHVYFCKIKNVVRSDTTYRWVTLKGMSRYPMPSGSVKILEFLQSKRGKNEYTFNE